jgi:hypothetical protein
MSPVLHIDAGGNPISIRDYKSIPDIIQVDKLDDFNLIYEWLAAGQPASTKVKEMGLTPGYKTLIIDHITDIQRMSFRQVVGTTNVGPGSIPATAEIQHFNKVLGQMVNFARLFFALDMHVLMTALERSDKDELTGAFMQKPLLWGQSSSEVSGYAYVVARLVHRTRLSGKIKMAIGEDVINDQASIVALFRPSGKYIAKDQYLMLGDYMADPTMTKIYELVLSAEPIPL